jgi:hypothetical protein
MLSRKANQFRTVIERKLVGDMEHEGEADYDNVSVHSA